MTQSETGLPPTPEQAPVVRLRRSRDDRVLGGVAGGLGAYFGVDPVWFRLAFVVLAIGGGSGILIYLLAWLIIPPQAPDETLNARDETSGGSDGALVAGVVLVAVGLMLLFNNLFPWFDRILWPLVVISAGLALLYTGRRHDD